MTPKFHQQCWPLITKKCQQNSADGSANERYNL